VNAADEVRATQLTKSLLAFKNTVRALPGIEGSGACDSLVRQLIDSIRRVRYVQVVAARKLSPLRADPSADLFDPIMAAILQKQSGAIDEASWLVFLSVHFGKHRLDGWRLARDVYGALGAAAPWTWERTSADAKGFRKWLDKNHATLSGADGVNRRFGNHRKYQSLDAHKVMGTGAAIESYVKWVGQPRTHSEVFEEAIKASNEDPRKSYDWLYDSLRAVISFGRTARFDYLSMIGKVGLAAIEPGSTYMVGATGPFSGARLLFGADATSGLSRRQLDAWLIELDGVLNVGMEVMEDALCNWQKSPDKFRPFRG
jgi:hypothetical protein